MPSVVAAETYLSSERPEHCRRGSPCDSDGRRDSASALLYEAPLRCCKSNVNCSMKCNQRVCCPNGSFARFWNIGRRGRNGRPCCDQEYTAETASGRTPLPAVLFSSCTRLFRQGVKVRLAYAMTRSSPSCHWCNTAPSPVSQASESTT